ncbi:MAG: KH domain-containing protein [Firmicutes bacterium]|nr:KH domain-containing protein [Bacillota bacterium]
MRELVEVLCKALVDQPDQVDVRETENERTVIIEVRVASSDMGKVIGKQGRIAKAIRTLVKSASVRSNKRVTVEFV